MNKSRQILALVSLVSVGACDGLKEALTAHVDVAARAGSQELTVQRLADLMGKSQVPIRKEVAQSIAEVWINYQLLGQAAAEGDSLNDPKLIDDAMWPVTTSQRTQKWYEMVSRGFVPDTSNLETKFNEGVMLGAKHILFQVPQGQQATGSDSVRRKAEGVLKQTTAANFGALAKQHGSDGTKDVGGDLGLFAAGAMVPEFEQAIRSLKPGEIGPLVKTQFGYHIVRRATYADVKDKFSQQYFAVARRSLESTYVANVEKAAKIEVKPDAAKLVKEVAADPSGNTGNRGVVATYYGENFTAGRVARWISGFPQQDQLRMQLQQAPDSLLPAFVKNLLRNELLLRQADSAKITLDSTELKTIRQSFGALVMNAWAGLRVSPALLADSAKTRDEKVRLAAGRIDGYLDRLIMQQEQFIEVSSPLQAALHAKYNGKVNTAGLDRAVESATKLRAAADSARAAQAPKSAVPVPGPAAPADTGAGKK